VRQEANLNQFVTANKNDDIKNQAKENCRDASQNVLHATMKILPTVEHMPAQEVSERRMNRARKVHKLPLSSVLLEEKIEGRMYQARKVHGGKVHTLHPSSVLLEETTEGRMNRGQKRDELQVERITQALPAPKAQTYLTVCIRQFKSMTCIRELWRTLFGPLL